MPRADPPLTSNTLALLGGGAVAIISAVVPLVLIWMRVANATVTAPQLPGIVRPSRSHRA